MITRIRRLRRIFLLTLLVLVAGVLSVTGYTLWRLRAESIAGALEVAAMHSRSFEDFVTQSLNVTELATINAVSPDGTQPDPRNVHASFLTTLRHAPYLRSVSLQDETGRILASSNEANIGLRVSVNDYLPRVTGVAEVLRVGQPWSGRDFADGKRILGSVAGRGDTEGFIPLARTVVIGTQGVTLLIALNPDYFINHIAQKLDAREGTVEVLRYDGTLLMTTSADEPVGSLHEYVVRDLRPAEVESGQLAHALEGNRQVLTAFRASRLYPFVVVTHINQSHALRHWRAEATTVLSVIVSSLLAVIFLATAYYRRQQHYLIQSARTEQLQRINARVFDASEEAIIITDANAHIISVNAAFTRITGYDAGDVMGHNPRILASGRQDRGFYEHMWGQLQEEGGWSGELVNRRRDGVLYHAQLKITTSRDVKGEVQNYIGVITDVSQRKQAETKLHQAASVFTSSQEGILITDADQRILDVNPAFTRITGYERAELLGKNPRVLSSGRQPAEFYAELWKTLTETGSWHGELWNRRKSGEIYPEHLSIDTVRDIRGEVTQYVAVFTDITGQKQHQAELDRIAHYDPLTGVPNRRLLVDRLGQATARARRKGSLLAVCYLDLDGFKLVNDQHGHASGDGLLIETATRLLKVLRGEDTLARMGGDEFVLLFTDLVKQQEVDIVLNRVLSAVSAPMLIGGTTVSVSASIGVTLFPWDDVSADTLLRHADQAMYRAKEAGKNRYHVFDPEHDREVQAQRSYLKRLAEALRNGEFVLHYQPQADLLTGEIIGVEALIRWQHPEQGLLLPFTFLHAMVGSDLEIQLGNWVIDSVLQQMQAWRSAGVHVTASANVSAHQLLNDNFVGHLRQTLLRYPELDRNDLELEILETAALSDLNRATEILTSCHELGVRFALDDFGTGYSSMTYFQRLPVDMLKIDQSFVRDMLVDPNALGIVESVIRLAHTFNRPVIAEGVATPEHGSTLIQLGCHLVQGFGVARPMPAEELPAWLARWRKDARWRTFQARVGTVEDLPLVVAAQSHRQWAEHLTKYFEQAAIKPIAELESGQCRFGRWYRGNGTVRYGTLPEFQALARLHEAVHMEAQGMTKLVLEGRPDAARARLPEFLAASQRFLAPMDELIRRIREQHGAK